MSEPFVSFNSLGNLKSQYHISAGSRRATTVLGFVWVILLCVDIGVSISVFFTSYNETNDPLQALIVPLFCVGMFALPGVIILYQQWWTDVRGVAFYDLGLAVRTRKGTAEIAWKDIETVWLEWNQVGNARYSSAKILTYAFRVQNGTTYKLRSNLENFEALNKNFYEPAVRATGQKDAPW